MDAFQEKCPVYMKMLCTDISNRSVGSEGNRAATLFFKRTLQALGWNAQAQEFDAMDWIDGGAKLFAGRKNFPVLVSPYSNGCDVKAELVSIATIHELEQLNMKGKIILLHGEIAKEQLMPKNFVFYNPEEHQRIIALLEKGAPAVIVSATGKNPALAGGISPFPLIEDGDFHIPSVYMTKANGSRLLRFVGKSIQLQSISTRVPGKGYNIIARKGNPTGGRIVITAHIDAKKGTPGALDNAGGVVILMLLAELLKDYRGSKFVELVAFNGEDYYSAPGQMKYIQDHQAAFQEILLNINIDGAGYRQGPSAISFYGLPDALKMEMAEAIRHFNGIIEGKPWVQGDHSIFIQHGRPAVAISSQWFTDHIDRQNITHTAKDKREIVNCEKLIEIAQAINFFIRRLDSFSLN